MFDRKRITFCCEGIPYERIQYLEGLGVKVWPTHDIHKQDDDSYIAAVQVAPGQYHYAAGLLQGMAGTYVLEPPGVKPIQPRTRWGVTNQSSGGPLTAAARIMASVVGIQAKTPPVAPKPARPQKTTATRPTAPKAAPAARRKPAKSTKRKSSKLSAIKRIWDSLSDE